VSREASPSRYILSKTGGKKRGQLAIQLRLALEMNKLELTVQAGVVHVHQDLVLARLRFLPLDQPRG
jgi:hypothetical protein